MRAGAAYGGEAESVPAARDFVTGALARAQEAYGIVVPSRVVGVAQLVVSELVTNACKYAPGPCGVEVEITGTLLQITVRDSNPALPIPQAPGPGRVGQHGLELVLALCEGIEIQREPVGKRITTRITVAPAAEQAARSR
ncbi:ATP-binding protein [Streptomyces atacamensis]|jgi:anti-sigma regulatory factor (Ser/Thr protein kinase)|uniref:ATP-binding protein n=1 Tax=Streptomyces atacamensis TaxID=531966 RepID=UPI00399D18E7